MTVYGKYNYRSFMLMGLIINKLITGYNHLVHIKYISLDKLKDLIH